jgi:hypothetical protein
MDPRPTRAAPRLPWFWSLVFIGGLSVSGASYRIFREVCAAINPKSLHGVLRGPDYVATFQLNQVGLVLGVILTTLAAERVIKFYVDAIRFRMERRGARRHESSNQAMEPTPPD